jgi:hypothetical protein
MPLTNFSYRTEVNLIILFGINFTYSFCKLGHFIATQQILQIFVKWSSLQKVSKFTPKKFYEIDRFSTLELAA